MKKVSYRKRTIIAFVLMLLVFLALNYYNSINRIEDGTVSVDCNRTTYRIVYGELFPDRSEFGMQEFASSVMKDVSTVEHIALVTRESESTDVQAENFDLGIFTIDDAGLLNFTITVDGETTELKNIKWMFIE